jgi:hypothetical protein
MRSAQVTPLEGGPSGSAPISQSGEIKYKSPLGGLQTADPLLGSAPAERPPDPHPSASAIPFQ